MMKKTLLMLRIKHVSKYRLLTGVFILFAYTSFSSQILYKTNDAVIAGEDNIAIEVADPAREIAKDNPVLQDLLDADCEAYKLPSKPKKITILKKADPPKKKKTKLISSEKKQQSLSFVSRPDRNGHTFFTDLSSSDKTCVTISFKHQKLARLSDCQHYINAFFYSVSEYFKLQTGFRSERFIQSFSIRPPPILSFV